MASRHSPSDIVVRTNAEEMVDGLFGQVFLWVFECLPYLHEQGIFPAWNIQTTRYGKAIPGVLDLAYTSPRNPEKAIDLVRLRDLRRRILGNDFLHLSALWHSYFVVPARVVHVADQVGSLSDCLGLHYRGNDKQSAFWDTNPVGYADYVEIAKDFMRARPAFNRVFVATDDSEFIEYLRARISLPVVSMGAGEFHKTEATERGKLLRADCAMLDCVLLARCGAVLSTSSALPSFAKILNPALEIYRVAASKFFTNTPYFPVAYIPIYRPSAREVVEIVDRLLLGDWTLRPEAAQFSAPFASREYWPYFLRWTYTAIRGLPGMRWISWLPNILARIVRKRPLLK
jgi:hypothetical protein